MPQQGVAPDGRPWVQPLDRAGWRAWLIAHHQTSRGVYLVTWRRTIRRPYVSLDDAIDEAMCVGWVDSKSGSFDAERTMLWFTPRRPRSDWSRSNKERVARLSAVGLMLPAGLAAIKEAKRLGTWTALDAVEDLVVPDDLAAAFEAHPPSRANWDAFSPGSRKALLTWIVQAKRPETRARRIEATAASAARKEKANEPGG
jgi:uncharacterized protein YdeI (YjbR/CyaY-like superfamily)